MILRQIADIKIDMLDKEPEELKNLIIKYDDTLIVTNNGDRTLNIKSSGDIHEHIQAISNAVYDWLGKKDLAFPVQMVYETFFLDWNTCLIKV